MGRTSLSSLHVHGPVAILISKMKQEKRKKKKKKNPTNRGGCVGCDVAVVVDGHCKVVVLMGRMSL